MFCCVEAKLKTGEYRRGLLTTEHPAESKSEAVLLLDDETVPTPPEHVAHVNMGRANTPALRRLAEGALAAGFHLLGASGGDDE